MKVLKSIIKKSDFVIYVYFRMKMLINRFHFRFNKRRPLVKKFIKNVGYIPNLKNPKSFNEKIVWLKLHWRDENATQCADKYAVRDYVEKKGEGAILNTIYGVYDKTSEIDFNQLPEKFVLKASHGSGMNIICTNKDDFNWKSAKKKLDRWMKVNYYFLNGEWVYRNAKPRIVCEKFIETEDNKPPKDFKIFCFNGIPRFLFVATDRGEETKFNFYTCEWDEIPVKQHYPISDEIIEKPENLEEMLRIARSLAVGFPQVRIDFYSERGQVIFGEMTFFHFSGTQPFEPVKYDYIFGEYLELPDNNYERSIL
ncbi:ATP-grasp fold amidoligase family protein [Salinicoccus siamensis]|uniref:ATP-grasp fold amidoligase family protein n=1 Tax=Salinicoccus siamensis TaxID=381830 RepID=A0ABV5Z691_9STAP